MTDIVKIEDLEEVKNQLETVNKYQQLVQKLLVKDIDYGVIPGTNKPTLLKPGAEKLAKIHGLVDEYELIKEIEDWNKPFFYYMFKCRLKHANTGIVVSEGIGSCNSMESKYRWKKSKEGRVENDEVYTIVNTIAKMAKKRAMVDAVLSACRLSAIYTQDVEDLGLDFNEEIGAKKEPAHKKVHNAFVNESKEEPATEAQKNALRNIISRFHLKFDLDINTLTKSQASFYIDKLQKEAQKKTTKKDEPVKQEQTVDVHVDDDSNDDVPF